MHPDVAHKKGVCWQCTGNGKLYSAFGGQQLIVVCDQCKGSGKPSMAKAA